MCVQISFVNVTKIVSNNDDIHSENINTENNKQYG